jgi:hypothetical protein
MFGGWLDALSHRNDAGMLLLSVGGVRRSEEYILLYPRLYLNVTPGGAQFK